MKIRITKANNVFKEGEVINVDAVYNSLYIVNTPGGTFGVLETDCEEVIEHNSQLYRKVGRPVREGDTVLVTKFDNDSVYVITTVEDIDYDADTASIEASICGAGYLDIGEGDDWDEYFVLETIDQPVQPSAPTYAEVSELLHEASRQTRIDKAFEKVVARNGAALKRLADSDDDIVEHNGKQYRKVKRNANVGDLVYTVNYIGGNAEPGDIQKVSKASHADGSIDTEEGAFFDTEDRDEYLVLEPIEQSDHSELDMLVNLAQEVAELKRQLANAQTDIADLEDRLDENEKDTEEVIGRINDVSDAVIPIEVIEKVIAELRELEGHAEKLCDHYEDNGIKELAQFQDGKSHAFLDAQKLLKEALRNG